MGWHFRYCGWYRHPQTHQRVTLDGQLLFYDKNYDDGEVELDTPSVKSLHCWYYHQYCRPYRGSGLPYQILRYANVYGPRQDPHGEAGVISIFSERLGRGDAIKIFARRNPGDAGCVRDYVFVADVVRANLAALEGRIAGAILDIGTGVETTTRALAEALRARLASTSVIEDAPPRPGDVERSVLDSSAARAVIGALTPLEHGLDQTVAWFRARSASTSASTSEREGA